MKYALTPCLEAGCFEPVVFQGRCETHRKPAWFGSNRGERLPKDWNTRRKIVLARDKSICYLCGNSGADTVDHVIAGDDHSLENLKAVHDRVAPHCHRFKSSREGVEARRLRQTKKSN